MVNVTRVVEIKEYGDITITVDRECGENGVVVIDREDGEIVRLSYGEARTLIHCLKGASEELRVFYDEL
jgi:hypothetical protein